MLKRLLALVFVLVVAGQASAGICACLETGKSAVHSCCKKKKSKNNSVSRKGCCDADCMRVSTETSPRASAERAKEITPSDLAAVRPAEVRLPLDVPVEGVIAAIIFREKPKRAPPPDLIVLNRSFRI
jgi:hypothetical protein